VARYPGTMSAPRGSLYAQLVNTHDNGIAWLRFAMAVLAVAAAALVVGQKYLLADPGPGLALVLLCTLPFIADAAWPQLLRPDWRLAAAMLAVFGGATALLAYRPADGDAAVLFFIALAAWVACAADPVISVPAGVLVVTVPAVASRLGGSHTPVLAAIGTAFAWVAGSAVRTQARTAAQLVAMKADAARHQIAQERQQLAREFHDLVAHTLSVTMLHMTAVRMSLEDGESGEALEALAEAQRAGREAMREMRQTVTLLGSSPPAGPSAALPHIRDLPDLVAGYVAAGLKADLDAAGDLTSVPGDVGLAAYRIAQESLTNAAKHSPGSAAAVSVRLDRSQLRLVIINDISSPASQLSSGPGPGHGIAGMTQRATLAGGSFSAGRDGSRWRVEAVLPVGDRP
jgi:signal transduction histidine kinase